MHEMSLFKDLMHKVEALSTEHAGKKIVKMKIRLGALSHLSPAHFRYHFDALAKGSAAEHAALEIEEGSDQDAPDAQSVTLLTVELEA